MDGGVPGRQDEAIRQCSVLIADANISSLEQMQLITKIWILYTELLLLCVIVMDQH